MGPNRSATTTLAVALVAAACANQTSAPATDQAAAGDGSCVAATDLVDGAASAVSVSATQPAELPFAWNADDPVVSDSIDFGEVIPGGPPPDGIAPIEFDDACFESVTSAGAWLQPQSPVMVVEVGDQTRAYPLAILTRHEIVNDVIGDRPVLVTYCPLCNSGMAFDRVVDGREFTFGTSGRLYRSNLVMYDRQTNTLWSQFGGNAIATATDPDLIDTELTRLPTSLVGFGQLAESAPNTLVLSPQSGGGQYGSNPYPNYDGARNGFLYFGPDPDDRLATNARVVGIGAGRDPVAVSLDRLQRERVVEVTSEDRELVVVWAPGQASALDTQEIDAGDDVGSTGVYLSPPGGVRPAEADGKFVGADDTTWDLLGRVVDGDGEPLQPVARDDTFWFVWFAFQPDTRVAR